MAASETQTTILDKTREGLDGPCRQMKKSDYCHEGVEEGGREVGWQVWIVGATPSREVRALCQLLPLIAPRHFHSDYLI